VAVYDVDENVTPVLSPAMHTCVMSHLLVLVLVVVLLQLVLTTTLVGYNALMCNHGLVSPLDDCWSPGLRSCSCKKMVLPASQVTRRVAVHAHRSRAEMTESVANHAAVLSPRRRRQIGGDKLPDASAARFDESII